MPTSRLTKWAAKRDYRVATAGIEVLAEVRAKLEKRLADGLLEPRFFKENLGGFRYLKDSPASSPKFLVMVAARRPIHVVSLVLEGKRVEALLPPTYVAYRKTFEIIRDDLRENVFGREAEVEILTAPLKSVAVHLGMASYGRNNIAYVSGFGSGHQLCGFIVGGSLESAKTAPMSGRAGEIGAGKESALLRCSSCRACVAVCPTGAIHEERFLISAEKCYVLHSESRRPMPAGIGRPAALCVVGCLDCQQICPENKRLLARESAGVDLSAEETEAVLAAGRSLSEGTAVEAVRAAAAKGPLGSAWKSARAKFAPLGLTEDLVVFGRNLGFGLGAGKLTRKKTRK